MTKEDYKKLNEYLNEIFLYLSKNDSFFLNNMRYFAVMSEKYLNFISKYDLKLKKIPDCLDFIEIYDIAREIIKSINDEYLKEYDKILDNGVLDFDYSTLESDFKKDLSAFNSVNGNKEIILRTNFNYESVTTLVHEFMHYINDCDTINRYLMTEFISISCEEYARRYLVNKGINKELLQYNERLIEAKEIAREINFYIKYLILFAEFGPLDENGYKFINENVCPISKEKYESDCLFILDILRKREDKYNYNIKYNIENQGSLDEILSHEISQEYRYFFGDLLSFYCLEYNDVKDIVNLCDYLDKNYNIVDLLKQCKIYIEDEDFYEKINKSIEGHINFYSEGKNLKSR